MSKLILTLNISCLSCCLVACADNASEAKFNQLLVELAKNPEKQTLQHKELVIALHFQQGDRAKGMAAYSDLQTKEKPSEVAQFAFYRQLSDSEKSKHRTILGDLFKQYPENPRVLFEFGMSSLRLGSADKARLLFRKAITIDPLFAPPYYELAHLAESKGEIALVHDYCTKALLLAEPGSDLAKKAAELLSKSKAAPK